MEADLGSTLFCCIHNRTLGLSYAQIGRPDFIITLSMTTKLYYLLTTLAVVTICSCSQNKSFFPVKNGDYWGFVNANGKYIVNPIFDDAEYASCGIARVVQNGKTGYINLKGKSVTPFDYLRGTTFSEDKAFVCRDNKTIECINTGGDVLFSLQNIKYAYNFHEGLSRFVNSDGLSGFIDEKGSIVIAPTYDVAGDFSDDLAYVSSGTQSGYINHKGDFVFPLASDLAYVCVDGMVISNNEAGRYGFYNKNGEMTIQHQFDAANSFSDGLACVKSGKYGFINRKGEYVINPQYDIASPFSNGLAVVCQDGKYGYINNSGKVVINLQFDYAYDFVGDYAFVKNASGRFGLINKKGGFAIEPQFLETRNANDTIEGIGLTDNSSIPSPVKNYDGVIKDISVLVELEKDGGAWITQTWAVSDYSDNIEYYLPFGNMGSMSLSHFSVSEDGVVYNNIGNDWITSGTRSSKAFKCGLIRKGAKVELFWGIGTPGSHIWSLRYHLTDVVKAYDDADIIHMCFINEGIELGHAKVTIVPAFNSPKWTVDNTRIWGFGYYGRIDLIDGSIISETSNTYYFNGVINLVKFNKGMFAPIHSEQGSAQSKVDIALKGSSYK